MNTLEVIFVYSMWILLLLLLVCLGYYWKTVEGFESKNAIVVLTRGYDSPKKYKNLMARNRSLEAFHQANPHYDVLIFHEGNITESHQKYLQSKTTLPLTFKTVSFQQTVANRPQCPNTPLSDSFSYGYKNMCRFWSITFLEELKDYEYVIRIDEDCVLTQIKPDLIARYTRDKIYFSSAHYQTEDVEDVVVGMKDFFDTRLEDRLPPPVRMPYTNVMIVNIPYFRQHTKIQELLSQIDESQCIFSNRWGDLPIWGYLLSYWVDPQHVMEDKTLSYHHGSHAIQINP